MSALAWVIVGVLGEAVFTSLASMWHVEYVFPQWFLVVMMFVAVNRELFSALGVAVLLGVVVGRFALASPRLRVSASPKQKRFVLY